MSTSKALELADIFRLHSEEFRRHNPGRLSGGQMRVLSAIEKCRTAALGGHLWQWDQCGAQKISYNSCRNRHCPKCQSLDKERWLERRCSELLAIPYFHLVFTLPHELNPWALTHPQWLYDLLFRCASEAEGPHPGRDREAPRGDQKAAGLWLSDP